MDDRNSWRDDDEIRVCISAPPEKDPWVPFIAKFIGIPAGVMLLFFLMTPSEAQPGNVNQSVTRTSGRIPIDREAALRQSSPVPEDDLHWITFEFPKASGKLKGKCINGVEWDILEMTVLVEPFYEVPEDVKVTPPKLDPKTVKVRITAGVISAQSEGSVEVDIGDMLEGGIKVKDQSGVVYSFLKNADISVIKARGIRR